MKLAIEEFDTDTGWSSSDLSLIDIHGLNEIDEFIANDNSKSLIVHFNVNSKNAYIEKTLSSIDVSNYNEITFNIFSVRSKNKGIYYNDLDDFLLKIDFDETMKDFMIPVYDSLVPITIDISDIDTLERIRITSNTNTESYLVFSHMVAVTDELPYDIFRDLKTKLENERDAINLNRKYQVGIITGAASDVKILIEDSGSYQRDWLEKYSVIEIDDGVNSEIHQLWENNENDYYLAEMYDGNQLLNDFTNAAVYLYFPVEFGLNQTEILLPGIGIHELAPLPITRGEKTEEKMDSYREDRTVKIRNGLQIYHYSIRIDIEARQKDLIADASYIIRNVLAKEKLWVNGKKFWIKFDTDSIFIDAIDATNQIPKLQYTMLIEIKEERFTRSTLVNTTTINRTYNII
jgi:hypothetical protein